MSDPKQTDADLMKTQEFTAARPPVQEDDEQFRAAQDQIKRMIAANAPLNEIL